MVTGRHGAGSAGRWRSTGASSVSRPSSASIAMPTAVNALVTDAIWKRVSGRTGVPRARSATP
jgi:hypothetical protein